MNFLGHLYLSGDNEDLITGNFIADHVKGNGINRFNKAIRNGILFHRDIDQFTDSHPQFILSKDRLVPNYRKYAGVIVDMYYDHFLSAFWATYSNEPIEKFTRRMYKILLKRFLMLPPKTKRILPFMAKDNWLVGYGKPEGLRRALSGMAYRTPFDSGMERAVNDLHENYGLFKQEFETFFPEIIEYTNQQKAKIL
jgi:acyl carrier protein phosphodiesterase